MRAVHQPARDLLQLFQKRSLSHRQGAVHRDHAAKPSKAMPTLQGVFRTKGKEPALLPELRRRPKAEESSRATAQETGVAVTLLGFKNPHKTRLFRSENAGRNTVIPEHTKSRFITVTERR